MKIHRAKKPTLENAEAFLTKLLRQINAMPAPGEEDFWAFTVAYDDPDHPGWDEWVTLVGGWAHSLAQCAPVVGALLSANLPISLTTFQGEGAHRYLATIGEQERAYQQAIKARSNN